MSIPSWLPFSFTLAATVVGFIVWLIRLESQIAKTNTITEMQKSACTERHVLEKQSYTEDMQAMKYSIDKLFDLMRNVEKSLSDLSGEIRGWKNGPPKSN